MIEFAVATPGKTISRAAPIADSAGRIESIPIAILNGWTRWGVQTFPDPRYRAPGSYDNPTG